MDIFNTDGDLDFDKANAGIKAAAGISHGHTQRTGDLDVIRTAALVSIADSLRTLAIESALAMDAAGHLDIDKTLGGAPIEPDTIAIVEAPEGAIVTLHNGSRGRLTGKSGVSEGSAWVGFVGDETAPREERVWTDDVASLAPEVGPEPADLTPFADAEPETEVDLNDHVDDIDADFDGDAHPAAEDAVAKLKERRKAAKKGKA